MELHARLYPSDEYVKSVFPRVLEEVDLAEFMLKEVLGVSAREGVHRESLTFVEFVVNLGNAGEPLAENSEGLIGGPFEPETVNTVEGSNCRSGPANRSP